MKRNRYTIVLFFVLAYASSWGSFLLSRAFPTIPLLFPFGPLLAALIIASFTGGMKDLLSRCTLWRVGLRWYAAALFFPAAIGLTTIYLSVLLGGLVPTATKLGPWYSLILMFPLALVDAPLGEESDWRGFALPRFPGRHSPLFNTLILGLLVVGWHVPLVLSERAILPPYLIAGLASAIVTNWVYYNARGSALLAMLYHTAANTMALYFAPMFSRLDLVRYFRLLASDDWMVAAIVVRLTGLNLQRMPTKPVETVQVSRPFTAKG